MKFKIKFSRFKSYKNITRSGINRKSLSVQEFSKQFKNAAVGEKNETPTYVMAELGDKEDEVTKSLRHKENIINYTGIVLDVDNKVGKNAYRSYAFSKQQLTKKFGDYHFIIHTSFSSKPKHEKYRIIILLAHPIPKEKLKSAVNYFTKELNLGEAVDDASKTISQCFFFPVRKKADSKYRLFINNKSELFNPDNLPNTPCNSIATRTDKKQRKALSVDDFNYEKVDLNKLRLSADLKQAIITGDATRLKKEGYESRSEFCYAVILKLAALKLEDQVIANIVLDATYA